MAAGFCAVKASANEVMTLAAKAARGAGAPPAQAAEFGRAVVCHLRAGRDAAPLWGALAALPRGAILDLPLAFARVLEAADQTQAQGLVPCTGDMALVQSYADGLPFAHSCEVTPRGLHLHLDLTTPAQRPPIARLAFPQDLAAHMQTLAARTYVPESEASRLSGAGAGLTDND